MPLPSGERTIQTSADPDVEPFDVTTGEPDPNPKLSTLVPRCTSCGSPAPLTVRASAKSEPPAVEP